MGSLTDALTSLQADAVLSYLIAFCIRRLPATGALLGAAWGALFGFAAHARRPSREA